MADKVQFILEEVIDQGLYLHKKGIFSQQQLSAHMRHRERHENALIKATHRLTDHLRAIEFEYSLERLRRYRMDESSKFTINPKYKKTDTKDFSIVKRILQLWDRTMHRYWTRIDLWKQYLGLCYVLKSKKAFYKALSNAVKKNPFELDLWLAGVYYEFEQNKNPWKGRKIFLKALKLNKKNQDFWEQYLKYELQFAEIVLKREQILEKGPQTQMIGHDMDIEEEAEQPQKQDEEEPVLPEGEEGEEREKMQKQSLDELENNFVALITTVMESAVESVEAGHRLALFHRLIATLKSTQSEVPVLKRLCSRILKNMEELVKNQSSGQAKDKLTLNEEQKYEQLLEINYNQQFEELKARFATFKTAEKLDYIKYFQPEERLQLLGLMNAKEFRSAAEQLQYYLYYLELDAQNLKSGQPVQSQKDKRVSIALQTLSLHKNELATYIKSLASKNGLYAFKKLINSKISPLSPAILSVFLKERESLGLGQLEVSELLKRADWTSVMKDVETLRLIGEYYRSTEQVEKICELKRKLEILEPGNRKLSNVLGF